MKKQCNLLILLVLIPFLGFSNTNDFTFVKQKSIKKAYFVNLDAGLNIDNSYGTIFVTTWDEDKIELDILIKVSGDRENWVNERINDINVDITALKGLISAKTVIANSSSKYKGKNNSFEINYIVKIPKNGSVKLNNKYGNITTTDLFANTDINCKYGKINLGKLNGNRNAILMQYCTDSSIDFLKNGTVNAKYSEIKIGEVVKLDLISDYTDVVIQESGDVKYLSKYGTIKIQNVNSLDASGNYLTIKIGSVFNQLRLNTKYSNVGISSINAKANNIAIVAGYSGISIGYQPNYFFDFNVSVKYADFKYDSDLDIYSKEDNNNSKLYSGFNKKKGINNLSVISDYGNVSLTKKQ